ncbi:MAG: DUF3307 domain-containing protein [Dysgonamonadaceae bacterium]|jgi:hypothetical protein|nr:DUF3307 domain-containing protein [Dysgonamonadaceae bacterium]
MNTLLTLQLTAHLLADFNFQPQKWCDIKERKIISKEHLYHTLVVFICSWIFSLILSFWWVALIISLCHLVIDVAKSYLFKKENYKKFLFFIDQALHITIITGGVFLFSRNEAIHFLFSVPINVVYILFALIACTKPSNVFIKNYMEANNIISAKKKDNTLLKAGRVIGSLERIISFSLILFNQFAAVGFIIAAKSILRFRDTDTAKTEYLLIGSLLSFGIAILLGIAYCKLLYLK